MDRRAFVSSGVGVLVLSAGCLQDNGDDGEASSGTDTPDGSPTPTEESPTPTDEPSTPTDEPSTDPSQPAVRIVETGAAETAGETVTLDDVIERTVEIENEGSDSDTVLVTLTAVGPDEERFLDDGGHETVTVDPGGFQEVVLSWTPTVEVPEGEYDLVVGVWMETDPDERATQLDERTEENAFTVEKPTGTLLVATIPDDTMVAVDGTVTGERTLELPVGTYEVEAHHANYETKTVVVTVRENETTGIQIDLTED